MSCPTCSDTMQSVVDGVWWCPRCGTLKHAQAIGEVVEAPNLVARCRLFELRLIGRLADLWDTLGISEGIYPPEHRRMTVEEARATVEAALASVMSPVTPAADGEVGEYAPGVEVPCRPGGNYGLCRTHPTCDMVQGMLKERADLLKRWITMLRSPSQVLHDEVVALERETALALGEPSQPSQRG